MTLAEKIVYLPTYIGLRVTVLKLFFYKLVSYVFAPYLRPQKIWLIMERGMDAQDNGWHLFRYLKDNHPEVNVRYAIKKISPDYYNNLSEFSDVVVEYDSFWYYMLLFNAKVMASTHSQTYLPKVWGLVKGTVGDITAKKVFLQHGIIHNEIPGIKYPELCVDLFICGASSEYKLLQDIFNYPINILGYTGLARFDNLYERKERKQILIMPTWRIKYSHYSKADFENTDFFLAYKEILTNIDLLQKLEDYDYEIKFYNHFEFQKFNSSFEPFCNGRIKLQTFGKQSVQEMLKESKVLVTDYSSVYYDFIYMKKPVVFFLLNQKTFRASQYGRDFDDVSDFGYAFERSTDVAAQIMKLIENQCEMDEKYLLKSNEVFPFCDKNNCSRIYQAIKQIID